MLRSALELHRRDRPQLRDEAQCADQPQTRDGAPIATEPQQRDGAPITTEPQQSDEGPAATESGQSDEASSATQAQERDDGTARIDPVRATETRPDDDAHAHADTTPLGLGRRAWVHLHLPTGRYSIKVAGRPVFYADEVVLSDATFHVNPRLRAAFEARPSRRTVHAHIIGTIRPPSPLPNTGGDVVSCNPFRYRGFARSDGARAVRADRVILTASGRIVALGLQADPDDDVRRAIPYPNRTPVALSREPKTPRSRDAS